MPIGKRATTYKKCDTHTHIRSCVVESAKRLCDQVQHPLDKPCNTCVYNAALMHAEFLSRLPTAIQALPQAALCAAILSAGLDA